MDVLQNYTTYQSFYSLLKKIEDDPEYDKKKAQKKLKAYVESHEHAIKKKSILMINHFMENVVRKKRMGGLAKAMLVTSSRANAVKYKKAFVIIYMSVYHVLTSSLALGSAPLSSRRRATSRGP